MSRLAIVVLLLLVTGCGSGSQELSSAQQTSVYGKAARSDMTSATVFLKDCNNRELSTETDPDGSYCLNTTGLNKPYLMKAVFANHSTVYAIVPDNGVAYLNESTNWIAQLAAAGLDLAELYLYIKGSLLILLANIAGTVSDALLQ